MRIHWALAGLALVAACDPTHSPARMQQSDVVRAQEAALAAAVHAENAEQAASYYAPDAVLYNPGAPPASTPDAIRQSMQQLFDDPNGALTFETDMVVMASASDYAVTDGHFTITYSNAQHQAETHSGHYVTLWRRQDNDSWKIMRDIATPGPTDAMAPPPAP